MGKFNLDDPIFKIGNSSFWTVRNSVEGLQIFGGIGSGKTSGSGRFIASKFLSYGYGGLILTVKPDEKDDWIDYCQKNNRIEDLLIIEPRGEHYFNFLEYESHNKHGDQSYTENIMQVLKTVIRASEEKTTGKNNDPFWETALDMLIANTIDLCQLAYNKVTVESMYEIARAANKINEKKQKLKTDGKADGNKEGNSEKPKEGNSEKPSALNVALDLAQSNIMEKVKRENPKINASKTIEELSKMTPDEYDALTLEFVPELRTLLFVIDFFTETYADLSEKTRSIVDFSFTGFLFRLLRDPAYSLFCNKPSTFTPEECLKGKIILINLPVKIYHKVGRDIQIMFKYIWQRAMEKRNIPENGRPVFLWADEAQNFLHEYDAEYQATARSCRIATVYISQNLPNYYANMGGTHGEFKVKSFLGTLATKLFHANADIETNKYASELIGEAYQAEESEARNSVSGKLSVTKTMSSQLRRMVRPEQFNDLATGGPLNNYKVRGYIHIQGKTFPTGFNHSGITFNQDNKP